MIFYDCHLHAVKEWKGHFNYLNSENIQILLNLLKICLFQQCSSSPNIVEEWTVIPTAPTDFCMYLLSPCTLLLFYY